MSDELPKIKKLIADVVKPDIVNLKQYLEGTILRTNTVLNKDLTNKLNTYNTTLTGAIQQLTTKHQTDITTITTDYKAADKTISDASNAHIARRDNPHGVTQAQLNIITSYSAPSGNYPVGTIWCQYV